MSVTVMGGARRRAHTHALPPIYTHRASGCRLFGPPVQVCVWFVCLMGQSQTWLFALLPQIVLHSPATCHFVLKAQLLSW